MFTLTPQHLVVFQRELLVKTGNAYQPGNLMPAQTATYLNLTDPETITLYYVCDESMKVTYILCRGPDNTDPQEPDTRRVNFSSSQAYKDGYKLGVMLLGNYMSHG